MYKCCKFVVCYFLCVGGRGVGWQVPLVYECCKIVCGTPCGIGVGGGWSIY